LTPLKYVIDLFTDLIAGSLTFSASIASHFSLTQRTIETLTTDQYTIISFLRSHKRVAISGCAGSGKTLVAAEKAVRLDRAGLSTLMLCHNPFLAGYLRSLTAGTGVRVDAFAHWVSGLLGHQSPFDANWTHFDEPSDSDLARAFDLLTASSNRYDAVIVDEGQDFREEWWLLIQAALGNEQSGIIYIFYDDNQALLPFRSNYPLEQAPYSLSRNCRNAGEIFDLLKRFHAQAPEPSIHLEGRGIVKQIPCDPGGEAAAITHAVRLGLDLLSTQDLVVLTTEQDPAESSSLCGLEVELRPSWNWKDILLPHLRAIISYFGQPGDATSPHPPLEVPVLSDNMYPSGTDIQAVSGLAKKVARNMGIKPGFPFWNPVCK